MGPTRHGGSIKSCVEREKVSAAAKHFNVPRKTLDDRVRSDMHGPIQIQAQMKRMHSQATCTQQSVAFH